MEGPKIFFTLPLFGGIRIDETIVNAFLITAVIFILCKVLTHKMEKIPHKKTQIIAEKLVLTIDNLVESTMGKNFMEFSPYIMALFASFYFRKPDWSCRPALHYHGYQHHRRLGADDGVFYPLYRL